MLDKIKELIDKKREEKDIYKEYIKAFCECDKAKELYESNELYNELKEFINEEENEEF